MDGSENAQARRHRDAVFGNCLKANVFEAVEQRTIVAHGETVGFQQSSDKAPEGRKRFSLTDFLSPLPGLEIFGD
jgi:hypothetical protein